MTYDDLYRLVSDPDQDYLSDPDHPEWTIRDADGITILGSTSDKDWVAPDIRISIVGSYLMLFVRDPDGEPNPLYGKCWSQYGIYENYVDLVANVYEL